jgi:hypothetical protein
VSQDIFLILSRSVKLPDFLLFRFITNMYSVHQITQQSHSVEYVFVQLDSKNIYRASPVEHSKMPQVATHSLSLLDPQIICCIAIKKPANFQRKQGKNSTHRRSPARGHWRVENWLSPILTR